MIDPDADPDQLDLEDLLACDPSSPLARSAVVSNLAEVATPVLVQDNHPLQLMLPLPGLIEELSSDTAPSIAQPERGCGRSSHIA